MVKLDPSQNLREEMDYIHADGVLEDLTREVMKAAQAKDAARKWAIHTDDSRFLEADLKMKVAIREFLEYATGVVARFPEHINMVDTHTQIVAAIKQGARIANESD